jgi:hypothetical protein
MRDAKEIRKEKSTDSVILWLNSPEVKERHQDNLGIYPQAIIRELTRLLEKRPENIPNPDFYEFTSTHVELRWDGEKTSVSFKVQSNLIMYEYKNKKDILKNYSRILSYEDIIWSILETDLK